MDNSGEPLLHLAVLIGIFLVARHFQMQMFPTMTKAFERMLKKILSFFFRHLVSQPLRRFGVMKMALLFCVLFSVFVFLLSFIALADGNGIVAASLFLFGLWLVGLAFCGWYVWRFFARRRYTPRPMPARRQIRR